MTVLIQTFGVWNYMILDLNVEFVEKNVLFVYMCRNIYLLENKYM